MSIKLDSVRPRKIAMVLVKRETAKAVELKTLADHYSVKTICQLTGLNEHTLRAWERRYQLVSPNRLDNGRRVYSVEDLEKLKLVTLLVRKGFLIGNIAQNSLLELSALVNNSTGLTLVEDTRRQRSKEYLEDLRRTIAGYELLKVHSLLQQARVEYGIRDFLLQIVLPFMGYIGDAVESKRFGIGQEHAWSAIIRSELMQTLYLLTHSHALMREQASPKTFAIATVQGNQHEFGALISAVLCAFHGYSTFYFGPNMPADALAEAGIAVGANCIIIGLPNVSMIPDAQLDAYVKDLRQRLPSVCELWMGGLATQCMLENDELRVLMSLTELDQLLATIRRI